MAITYRKLQPNESKLYREIRLEALKNHPDSFASTFEDESIKLKLAYEEVIEAQPADRFAMGAFDDERLIGICGFYQELRVKERHKGWIIQMYVKPGYKGWKAGLNLLNATIHEAFKIQEMEQILLGVTANNLAALRIYGQAGFTEYGYHKGYTKDSGRYIDERLMILFKPQ